jgi:RimJ/RimL family protein N-acetyltransferase
LIKSTIFAITSLSTNDVVGAIQLEYNETNRTYISYFLETQFRGLGIAEKAMRQALILHIKVSESNVIWAKCLRTNNKSIQLLERLGFIFQRLIASSLHYNEILEYKMVNCNEGSNDNPINVKLFPLSIDLLNVHFLGSDSSISIEPTK